VLVARILVRHERRGAMVGAYMATAKTTRPSWLRVSVCSKASSTAPHTRIDSGNRMVETAISSRSASFKQSGMAGG